MEAQANSDAPKRASREQKYLHFALLPEDEALLVELSPEQQSILRTQGSYRKRAEALGIAIGTVRSRLHRAREALSRLRAERDADRAPAAQAPRPDAGLH